jgi:hypothetical protein
MRLGEVAYVRSGDKGNILNLSMVPADPADHPWLCNAVTAERVAELYGPLVDGEVVRYELPEVPACNFVLRDSLGGGVSKTLAIDPHGKSWGALLMALEIGERPMGRADG